VAKRGRKARGGDGVGIGIQAQAEGPEHPGGLTSDTLGDFAEDLGRVLGSAQSKATAWLGQRKAIAEQLTQIRDTANQYLQQLAGAGASFAEGVRRGRRRGRPPGSQSAKRGPGRPKGSGKKKRTMSAAARKAISDAQKKRWAKQKAQG
jgi:hypothetical protein